MRAMRATGFNGYGDLELVNHPKPQVSDGKVLVRMTAAALRLWIIRSCLATIPKRRHRWCLGMKERAS